MKHSTFRKSTLISSIALLLVAIVALSGATFAWFSSKTSASADDMTITSGAASGLLVCLTDSANESDWGDTLVFNDESKELIPVSSAFTSAAAPTWFTATAENPNSFAIASNGSYTAVDNTTEYVKSYDFYAKTADGATKTLNISATGLTDTGTYGRIAVVNVTTGEVKVYYMAADSNATSANYPVASTTSLASDYPATPVNSLSTAIELGTISTSTHFRIYMWNEGQDYDCTSLAPNKTCSVDTWELTITG